MSPDDFRNIALSLPGASESAHMNHPDFRVGKKIFATLAYPDAGWGMVKLTPEQQREFVAADPDSFVPASGAWGARGSTIVRLRSAKAILVNAAIEAAWRNVGPSV